MPWPRVRRHPWAPPPLAVPLSELNAEQLEVIEADYSDRLARIVSWKADASLREVPYATGARDPGSLAGIWEALARDLRLP